MDGRMQGLDPAVQALGKPGDIGDIDDRQAGVTQRIRRTSCRQDLHAKPGECRGEFHDTRLV